MASRKSKKTRKVTRMVPCIETHTIALVADHEARIQRLEKIPTSAGGISRASLIDIHEGLRALADRIKAVLQ